MFAIAVASLASDRPPTAHGAPQDLHVEVTTRLDRIEVRNDYKLDQIVTLVGQQRHASNPDELRQLMHICLI